MMPAPARQVGRRATLDLPFEDLFGARTSGTASGDRPAFPTLLHGLAFGLLMDSARECSALAARGRVRLVGRTRIVAETQYHERLVRWILGAPSVLSLGLCCELWDLDVGAVQQALLARLSGTGTTVRPRHLRRG